MAKGKQGRRRSHLALKKQQLFACPQCKTMIRPHTACRVCGSYKGRSVINKEAIAIKKTKKREKQK